MNNEYQCTRINTKIGEIRMRQVFALKNTGCFVLCGTFIGTCLIENPTVATSAVLGADLLIASYYGVRSCMYQRQINTLNKQKNKIKNKAYID